jgi:hypothetical protein
MVACISDNDDVVIMIHALTLSGMGCFLPLAFGYEGYGWVCTRQQAQQATRALAM